MTVIRFGKLLPADEEPENQATRYDMGSIVREDYHGRSWECHYLSSTGIQITEVCFLG